MNTSTDENKCKVPEVTLIFWIIKVAATTLGETGGDAVSMSMNLGYLIGTAIFGAIFIQYVPNIADQISKSAPAAIYGVLLIGLMYLMPTGVMGMVHRVWGRLRSRATGSTG